SDPAKSWHPETTPPSNDRRSRKSGSPTSPRWQRGRGSFASSPHCRRRTQWHKNRARIRARSTGRCSREGGNATKTAGSDACMPPGMLLRADINSFLVGQFPACALDRSSPIVAGRRGISHSFCLVRVTVRHKCSATFFGDVIEFLLSNGGSVCAPGHGAAAMYFRRKTSAGRAYLQIVESRRDGDQVRQQVIATLGRFDELQASGQLERLVRSGARFAAKAMVLSAASNDAIEIAVRRIGPALVFERLWEETGCRAVASQLAGKRKHGFALERAVFLTVLHRLFVSGSDRAADRWREDYAIAGVEGLDLHHLYRAMAWLGEELPEKEQDGRTPLAPRCVKDVVEERLF